MLHLLALLLLLQEAALAEALPLGSAAPDPSLKGPHPPIAFSYNGSSWCERRATTPTRTCTVLDDKKVVAARCGLAPGAAVETGHASGALEVAGATVLAASVGACWVVFDDGLNGAAAVNPVCTVCDLRKCHHG